MIKPAYSVSFLLEKIIFVWQNVLYFLDAPRINHLKYEISKNYRTRKNENIKGI